MKKGMPSNIASAIDSQDDQEDADEEVKRVE
jgi:hypothetical protein